MKNPAENKPEYGNWVSKRLLYGTILLGVVFMGLSFWHLAFIVLAIFFLMAFVYFLYAHHKFSPEGGDLQNKIRDLVLDHLEWDGQGKALDIGCGNGPLVIQMAKKYAGAKVTGIDYWGSGWDYSQKECEKNASMEGVADKVNFERASAVSLPYEDEHFEAVVSNFVFHEVVDSKDKKELVREALRVVKKGGVFSFQDLFLVRKIYGETDDLLEAIRSWGIEKVELVRTNELDFIPVALKLPFMVGESGIIHGKK